MDLISIILGISNISVAALLSLMSIPLVQRKVKMNRIYGIRIKSAFQSDENWYDINAYGGRQLIYWAIPLALLGVVTFSLPLDGKTLLIFIIACAPLIVIIPAIMSWRYGNRLSSEKRRLDSNFDKTTTDGDPTAAHEG